MALVEEEDDEVPPSGLLASRMGFLSRFGLDRGSSFWSTGADIFLRLTTLARVEDEEAFSSVLRVRGIGVVAERVRPFGDVVDVVAEIARVVSLFFRGMVKM